MTRSIEQRPLLLLSLAVAGLCIGLSILPYCPPAIACMRAVIHISTVPAAVVVAKILGSFLVAEWAVLTFWTLFRTGRRLQKIPRVQPASELTMAAHLAGISRLQCIEAPNTAFCAGAFRPTVFVSRTLAGTLAPAALEAVLVHEQDHAARHEPLRRAMSSAVARTLFFVPLVGWFAGRAAEAAELRADRAVLARVGPAPLAKALWLLWAEPALTGTAAFAGVAQLRTAQLLGDPMPRSVIPMRIFLLSAVGLYLSLAISSCLLSLWVSAV